MKKQFRRLTEKYRNFNRRLKSWLEGLPPKAKMNTALVMMAFYLLIMAVVLIGTFRERNGDMPDIRHINPAPLIDTPLKIPESGENDTVFYYRPENNNTVTK